MNKADLIEEIAYSLATHKKDDFKVASSHLLSTIGYKSQRILRGQSGIVSDFVETFPSPRPGTAAEQFLVRNVQSVHILFQVTGDEIVALSQSQHTLFEADAFERGLVKSFVFVSADLKGEDYPRGQYALITREVSKRLNTAVVMLFRTSTGRVSVAFSDRRENKRNPQRDVLGNVSIIREIDPNMPHRAHLDTLAELSLPNRLNWMNTNNKNSDFDGLLAAWLDSLDTEELNRRFYLDLFAWFRYALRESTFPSISEKPISDEEHVIRLITRLLFVWFVKEKGLIAKELFIESQVSDLISGYERDSGDSYYRTILQNLFFGTLNTEMDRRGFSDAEESTAKDHSCYRYGSEINEPERLLGLFKMTPFINGGLFDCLDSQASAGDGVYLVDFYTEDVKARAGFSIPNSLFFGENGLITLFNRYKFTVEENTPAEEEVALDPELLGKVFENLLAAFNPETRDTVRKQTGSYYTPRLVVDYMVEEALVASLAELAKPDNGNYDSWRNRLHYLLDFADAFEDADQLFSADERKEIVQAVGTIKILDPAVGSGAFPISVLHKLTLALRRLDADNELWQDMQKALAVRKAKVAFGTEDPKERRKELETISATFERYRDSDYGRKLYLIKNSIYGVDIQPIACQIAKLRFFISLTIEQTPDFGATNLGIRPLPNLETCLVAADTLVGLKGGGQMVLQTNQMIELQETLSSNREQHFHATSYLEKSQCQQRDRMLRQLLVENLKDLNFPAETSSRIANWDPYDQNAGADWFDPQYMFGVTGGFDVVVGNPPYVESRNSLLTDEMKDSYLEQLLSDWGASLPRGSDLLIYFFPRSVKLLKDDGQGSLIVQNAWLNTDYGKKFQDFTLGRFSFQKILDTSSKFFPDSSSQNINAVITFFSKSPPKDIEFGIASDDLTVTSSRLISPKNPMKWGNVFATPRYYAELLEGISSRPRSPFSITFGQGLNFPKKDLDTPDAEIDVIVKDASFAAVASDGKIASISRSRMNKIPALVMPRGVGNRYYCIFNSCRAFSFSHVEMYFADELWESDLHYCLWAYMNSSFVWLYREITGRKNLGGGLLKAEATDMKALPVNFAFDFAADAKNVFHIIKEREPLPVHEEVYTEEHLLIDDMVSKYFGFQRAQETIRQSLLEQVNFRGTRARQR